MTDFTVTNYTALIFFCKIRVRTSITNKRAGAGIVPLLTNCVMINMEKGECSVGYEMWTQHVAYSCEP